MKNKEGVDDTTYN